LPRCSSTRCRPSDVLSGRARRSPWPGCNHRVTPMTRSPGVPHHLGGDRGARGFRPGDERPEGRNRRSVRRCPGDGLSPAAHRAASRCGQTPVTPALRGRDVPTSTAGWIKSVDRWPRTTTRRPLSARASADGRVRCLPPRRVGSRV
jgi:hypothetical protein